VFSVARWTEIFKVARLLGKADIADLAEHCVAARHAAPAAAGPTREALARARVYGRRLRGAPGLGLPIASWGELGANARPTRVEGR
jgi:hypothetical protein